MKIQIHVEDPDFLIVEKPHGISTQPLGSFSAGSLAGLLAENYPEIRNVGGSDWGAVHRLDRETSGLVVFARNEEAYQNLRSQFSKREAEKEYESMVEGIVAEAGRIDWPIGPDPKSAKRVNVYKNLKEARRWKAQEAVTLYAPVGAGRETSRPGREDRAPASLLRILIKTGRRHQIRAHLAAIGHPIVGDKLYGGESANRLFLHASRLRFRHPRGNQWVEAESPSLFSSGSQSAL